MAGHYKHRRPITLITPDRGKNERGKPRTHCPIGNWALVHRWSPPMNRDRMGKWTKPMCANANLSLSLSLSFDTIRCVCVSVVPSACALCVPQPNRRAGISRQIAEEETGEMIRKRKTSCVLCCVWACERWQWCRRLCVCVYVDGALPIVMVMLTTLAPHCRLINGRLCWRKTGKSQAHK